MNEAVMNPNLNFPHQVIPAIPQQMQQMQQMTGMSNPAMMQSNVIFRNDTAIPDEMVPETLSNPLFTPGFLQTQLGKNMRVEFLIGDQTQDRVGRLLQVGASYILLQSYDQYTVYMCDIHSIKFVSIVDSQDLSLMLTL